MEPEGQVVVEKLMHLPPLKEVAHQPQAALLEQPMQCLRAPQPRVFSSRPSTVDSSAGDERVGGGGLASQSAAAATTTSVLGGWWVGTGAGGGGWG